MSLLSALPPLFKLPGDMKLSEPALPIAGPEARKTQRIWSNHDRLPTCQSVWRQEDNPSVSANFWPLPDSPRLLTKRKRAGS